MPEHRVHPAAYAGQSLLCEFDVRESQRASSVNSPR